MTQGNNAIIILREIDGLASVAEETSSSTEESAAAAEEQASAMESISSNSQNLLVLAEKLSSGYKSQQVTENKESPIQSKYSTKSD